ncbi:restriction endonuclease subunit S [Geobacter benzoatilyticus]|uniref:Restriction endonuclease subunit S n=1 Tax=Geobacter benzoatilyticus TaxID=2815309 RepID=A0ABX7Q1Y5_9BACT|nr:restriction endonuclease subunit S [Geobacter benzoatilyticus]QSV45417.1 restriction endonuclease subunit S [Geobacter benzoatilyticus]
MVFPRYESYKPAKSKWLNEVPSHWKLLPGMAVLKEYKVRNIGMVEEVVLSLSYGNVIVKPPEKLTGLVPESFETYQVINPNDIIIRPTDLQNDQTSLRTGISKDRGIITSAYICLRPDPEHNPTFIHYLLHAYDLLKVYYGMGSGLRQNLDFRDFKRLELCIPPREEQDRIANFLDQKTAEIDETIAKKQRLIELLKEQKAILINKAVTKGLNPDVPMRDSGVEWIGEVSAHWAIKKIKHLVSFVSGGTPSKDNRDYWDGEIPWVSPKDMKARYLSSAIDGITEKAIQRTSLKLLNPGCVLIVVRGMILAKKIPVAISAAPLTINQDMKAMIPSEGCLPEFLLFLLDGLHEELSSLLEESGHGTKTFPTDKLGNFSILLPPEEEQSEIISYIKNIDGHFDLAISVVNEQSQRLDEIKKILIAEAVTGKIKI